MEPITREQAPLWTTIRTVSGQRDGSQLFSSKRIVRGGIFFYLQPLFRLYKEFNSQQSGISCSEFQIATFLLGAATTSSPG
jgi:hypothetical protein